MSEERQLSRLELPNWIIFFEKIKDYELVTPTKNTWIRLMGKFNDLDDLGYEIPIKRIGWDKDSYIWDYEILENINLRKFLFDNEFYRKK